LSDIYQNVKDTLYRLTGITLGSNKEIMIDNRLQKLLRDTRYSGSADDIMREIGNGKYVTDFINAFTTNKTHFFRETFHFDDLKDRVLPELLSKSSSINIYCSASSTGEEPYSIAMTVQHALQSQGTYGKSIKIEATDIDTSVLQSAKDGIYRVSTTNNDFPDWISLPKYFKRRVEHNYSNEMLLKVKDEPRKYLNFQQMNLMDDKYIFNDGQFDVVFCRNVLIYFSIEDQNKILKKLFKLLKVGGTLYLGHSENPLELTPYVKRMGHNIFLKLKESI
jgi:chemotaxis protein methyltransferase CheR